MPVWNTAMPHAGGGPARDEFMEHAPTASSLKHGAVGRRAGLVLTRAGVMAGEPCGSAITVAVLGIAEW